MKEAVFTPPDMLNNIKYGVFHCFNAYFCKNVASNLCLRQYLHGL